MKAWLALLCLAGAGLVWAGPVQLVSDEEVAREQAFGGQMEEQEPVRIRTATRSISLAPEVVLLAPKPDGAVKTPFPIRIQFVPAPGTEIDPASFKVLYGFLGLDITDRVLSKVQPSSSGITVDQAAIPAGQHSLRLQIWDKQGRKGETSVKLVVEK